MAGAENIGGDAADQAGEKMPRLFSVCSEISALCDGTTDRLCFTIIRGNPGEVLMIQFIAGSFFGAFVAVMIYGILLMASDEEGHHEKRTRK